MNTLASCHAELRRASPHKGALGTTASALALAFGVKCPLCLLAKLPLAGFAVSSVAFGRLSLALAVVGAAFAVRALVRAFSR